MSEVKNLVKQDNKEIENYRRQKIAVPPVDIFENDEEVLLVADLPGVDKKNLNINFEKNILTLEGHRKLESFGKAEGDFDELDYRREFTVPNGIDADKINASLGDGVLKLHLPKAAKMKPRQIQITAG